MIPRRSKLQIIYDLLLAAKQKSKIKPTHLLYRGNLSHNRLKLYLNELIQMGLIIELKEGRHIFYKVTEKGNSFLYDLEKMRGITEAFGL